MALHYNSRIVTNGLALHIDAANIKSYPGSGTTVADLSIYKTNTTLYQATHNSDGYFTFDGVDDNIYISGLSTNAPQLQTIRNEVSGEVVFYPYSVGGDSGPALFRCGLSTDLSFALLYDRINQRMVFHWYDTGFKSSYSSNNIVTSNSWNIISFSRNRSSISFYMNGEFVNTNTGLSDPIPTPANFGIGATRAGTITGTTGQDFAGNISSVKIYNRAISEQEVKQNFEALRGRYGI